MIPLSFVIKRSNIFFYFCGCVYRMMHLQELLIRRKINRWQHSWQQIKWHFTTVHFIVHITLYSITKEDITMSLATFKAPLISYLVVVDPSSK